MNLKTISDSVLHEIGLALATAQDEDPQQHMTDLQKHDKKYHPDGYEEGDACKYRDEMGKGDIVDRLDPENVDGEEIQYKKFSRGKHSRRGQSAKVAEKEELNPKTESGKESVGKTTKEIESSIYDYIEKSKAFFNDMFSQYEEAYQKEMENGDTNGLSKEDEAALNSCLAGQKNEGVRKLLTELAKQCIREMKPRIKSPEQLKMEAICRHADDYGVDLRAAIGSGGSYGKDKQHMRELKAKKKEYESKIDEMKEMMKLASPSFAAEMESALEEMEKTLKGIEDELSGKKPKDAKKEEKKESKVEKKETKNEEKKFDKPAEGYALDSLNNVSAKTTSVLGDADFKSIYDKLPEADKVLAVSDLHESDWKEKLKFKGRGTILIAGDLGDKGSTSIGSNRSMKEAVPRGIKWITEEFLPYLESHQDQKFVIMPGNRDHYMSDPSFADIKFPSNVSFVQDKEADVNGMKIYGLPWCEQRKTGSAGGFNMADKKEREQYYDHPIGKRPYEISDEKLKEWCDKVPSGLDVLMVHFPPKFDGYEGDVSHGQHCGSEIIADMIKRVKPKLVVCGHLHDGDHKPFKVGDSTIVNVAYSTDAGGSHHGAGGWHARQIGAIRDNGETGFILNGEKKMHK